LWKGFAIYLIGPLGEGEPKRGTWEVGELTGGKNQKNGMPIIPGKGVVLGLLSIPSLRGALKRKVLDTRVLMIARGTGSPLRVSNLRWASLFLTEEKKGQPLVACVVGSRESSTGKRNKRG